MEQVPPDSFFSVSQMVNHKGAGGQYQTVASATSSKKSNNKRGGGGVASTTTVGSSSISSTGNGNRYQKQPRIDHTNNKIEQTKKDSSNKAVTGK